MTCEYTLDFMLDKAYTDLKEISNQSNKLSIDKPEVIFMNRKTMITNFVAICKQLHRQTTEVQNYFDTELAVKSSVDQNGSLVITGRFKTAGIIKVVANYIKDYVSCKECASCDTSLNKENRILYINCNKCKSKKSLM